MIASTEPRSAVAAGSGTTVPGFCPPRQERSRVTVERLVRATEILLAERGPESLTVHDIVSRAGSSVGSFYARFEDRDAALRYVEERFWREAEARWDAYLAADRWSGRSPLEIVSRVIRDLVRVVMADRARFRAFLVQALAHPASGLAERTLTLDRRIARRIAALLLSTDAGIAALVPEDVVAGGFVRVMGAVRDAVAFGDGSREAPRDLALSLVRMYGSLLGLEDLPSSWSELLALCADPSMV